MKIFLIDGIGPFFRHYKKRTINWSKIPYHSFFGKPGKTRRIFKRIPSDLDLFCKKVSRIGYNAISFDDVAHLATDEWIEDTVNCDISDLQKRFHKLFAICRCYDLDIYLTMDVISLTPKLRKHIKGKQSRALVFMKRQIDTVLIRFPEVRGIIIRIGESDGKDAKGTFTSELLLKTPGQVNRLISELLPVFEKHKAYMILRNWTVGAYSVGDFLWHRKTTARVLKGINSPCFILSMKYGETDFFRYLPLNKLFFSVKVKKIIELQAKREYEGCGEYPSFVGFDYYSYKQQLESAQNMVGMSVWCQTGGWVPFRRLTFLEPGAIWNEINSFVSLKIFQESMSVFQAVQAFAETISCSDSAKLYQLLQLSDQAVKELLYTPAVARQKLFFRRVRVPSQFSVYWGTIFINHSIRKTMRALVHDGRESVENGYKALDTIITMKGLVRELNLPADDIEYMYDTFGLLALAREYYFLPYDDEIRYRIKKAKKQYKAKYPKNGRPRYRVKTDFKKFNIRSRHLRWFFHLTLRDTRGYRVLDHFLTLHVLACFIRFLLLFRPKILPKFYRKSGMGIKTIFR